MKWFVDSNIATAAIREKKLIEEEEDVECRPEMIPSSVLDENVDVCLVHHYFSAHGKEDLGVSEITNYTICLPLNITKPSVVLIK